MIEIKLRLKHFVFGLERAQKILRSLAKDENLLLTVGKSKKSFVQMIVLNVFTHIQLFFKNNLFALETIHVFNLLLLQVLKIQASSVVVNLSDQMRTLVVIFVR